MSVDYAIQRWQEGERRLRGSAADRQAAQDRVVDALVAELRRRLGGTFTAQELADLYDRGTAWCLDLAVASAPSAPWAWESATVIDGAFGRYLREAADFAGGRRSAGAPSL